ncbi:MAG: amino acid ABC transporter permease [Rhizobiales bacterium]|nr:amino acid ABC transporter permease [Hyphomicrobiales bacterium]
MTMSSTTFVRSQLAEAAPPPASTSGAIGWVRANLFSSIPNTILTLVGGYVAFMLLWTFIDFTLVRAVWTGDDRQACLDSNAGRSVGACWPFVAAKFSQFMYGFYPVEARWRVNLTYVTAIVLIVPLLVPSAPYKVLNAVLFFGVFPVLAFILLYGGSVINPWLTVFGWLALLAGIGLLVGYVLSLIEGNPQQPLLTYGAALLAVGVVMMVLVRFDWFAEPALPIVETRQWGGLLVTLVVAITGIVAALPIGVALALGRRSKLPIIRLLSVALIELVRGVPLITVLFFATYVLPLFLDWKPDGMVRVLVGVSIFSGAYMAEVVRGGLQAIPKGQFEGAQALGLNYPRMMGLVVLPQALKLVIPGIVNSFIGLFKDTTLVSIVALFDLLGMMRAGFTDPQWASPVTLYTGFAFAGIIYFAFCYFMSRYSIFIEKRLNKGRRH